MRITPRLLAFILALAVLAPALNFAPVSAKVKEIKFRGYITSFTSPTSFEVEDYHITRDESVRLEFENATAGTLSNPEALRMGTFIELKGM